MMANNENTRKLYDEYKTMLQKVADVKYSAAVLQWDQETYLPPKGADRRGQQLATLSELSHQMFTSESFGRLLYELNGRTDLPAPQQKNVSLTLEEYDKQKKFTSDFVRKMSEAVSISFHAWTDARKQNDFKIFEPALSTIVRLKKQEADILGFEDHPYNALMNEYEKGATVKMVDKVFADVMPSLSQLLDEMQQYPEPDAGFLHQHFPKQQQWDWGMYLCKQLGFDFEAGRQDISEHPFTTNFSSRDVRITTRIDENDLANMTWSTVHEVGHALYEQGLPDEEYGLPLGEYTSLSIHESQSRLWENCVARGEAFWKFYLPRIQEFFPGKLDDVDARKFLKAINKVQPSLIRTEADELTYHFHVRIRYELEKELIAGNLPVKDMPVYWKDQYKKLLGVVVPDDRQGCLQDVHWSHGSFGYFATYSLGSFYAAQFWEQAKADIPSLENTIESSGSTQYLLEWLRFNVHGVGKSFTSSELCKNITGHELDSKIFVNYLQQKLHSIYK